MENWERGTRNASGAKVRTFTGAVPRCRRSIPKSGYIPFQYAKSFGSKSGTGLRLVPDCTPASVLTGHPVSAPTGRKLPEEIRRAVITIRTCASTEKQIKAYVSAVDAIYSFLKADANAKAENFVRRYRVTYQNAEKRRGVWDRLHDKSYHYSNVKRFAIEKERYSARLVKMLFDAITVSGYSIS